MKTKLLVVSALLLGFAASSQAATIVGTKHDLSNSNSGSGRTIKSAGQNQVCVFCHVPHNGVVNKLLWNRTTNPTSFKVYTTYNSAEMRTALIGTTAITTGSNSLLCLSCHTLGTAAEVITDTANGKAGGDGTNFTSTTWATNAKLGNDLTNDHPVGISYAAALGAGAGGAFGAANLNALPAATKVFGTNGTMECATCHDVHGGVTGTKFLVMDNAGSALCIACHKK